jgi:hypothetical protein
MRSELIEQMKLEIVNSLKTFLYEEGIELYIAANDNSIRIPPDRAGVILECIEDRPLAGYKLLSEIRVILGILGKPWQCDALVDGLYLALHPHQITLCELQILLMSLHVESIQKQPRKKIRKRAVMRYIIEEGA